MRFTVWHHILNNQKRRKKKVQNGKKLDSLEEHSTFILYYNDVNKINDQRSTIDGTNQMRIRCESSAQERQTTKTKCLNVHHKHLKTKHWSQKERRTRNEKWKKKPKKRIIIWKIFSRCNIFCGLCLYKKLYSFKVMIITLGKKPKSHRVRLETRRSVLQK